MAEEPRLTFTIQDHQSVPSSLPETSFINHLKYHLKIVPHSLNVPQKMMKQTIDDAEDLDLVVPMYNWIEYSSIYSETTARLKFYFKDEATSFNADIANTNDFKSFKYKAINYSKTLKLIWQVELWKMQQLLCHLNI